jgi:hypothetical protein
MYTCISFPYDVDTTGGQQLQSAFFLEWGYHSRRSPIQVLTVPMLLHFCTQNRGNRCFNIVRPLALEFCLLCMVRQPSADAHVIWVARHKVTRPQTILKFRPPSSLDYRTRHGSQSLAAQCIFWPIFVRLIFSAKWSRSKSRSRKPTLSAIYVGTKVSLDARSAKMC